LLDYGELLTLKKHASTREKIAKHIQRSKKLRDEENVPAKLLPLSTTLQRHSGAKSKPPTIIAASTVGSVPRGT
jgi:hypothetical protein